MLEELNINEFIDDHLDTIKHVQSLPECNSYLRDQPWNRQEREGIVVVHSLAEFLDVSQ